MVISHVSYTVRLGIGTVVGIEIKKKLTHQQYKLLCTPAMLKQEKSIAEFIPKSDFIHPDHLSDCLGSKVAHILHTWPFLTNCVAFKCKHTYLVVVKADYSRY